MRLFQRIFFAAVLAGLIAGAGMSALQQWRVAPLILAAEVYENATPEAPVAHEHDGAVATHTHDEQAWGPQDGPEHIGYTVAANLLAAAGFVLLLAAASVLTGIEVTAANGVLWGLAGFAIFHLAPAFGLAPELPGMPAADLMARQVWWWGCALATATAIFGFAKFRSWPAVVVGVVLILLPHVVGAPQLTGDHESSVPAHLATEFAASTLFVGAAFWLAVGPLYGFMLEWLGRRSLRTVAA
jgi:cobalt transporter subunit CbtA